MNLLSLSASVILVLDFFVPTLATTYSLTDNIVGSAFYDAFGWEAIGDPTHGRVNYVDQATSKSQNLTFASSDTFVLRTNSNSILSPSGPGRNSVRIRTKKTYTTHVAVFDVRHMPQGCGTWPAIWETKGSNWPAGGEVDIVEGVNDQAPNAATLHTSAGCTMPGGGLQTGTFGQLNCDANVNSNSGCGVRFPTPNSYGPAFNGVGGGWFAVERALNYIKIWFWSRNDASAPAEVRNGGWEANPDNWGTPTAFFPDTSCNFPAHFQEHNIIINLTLCGDWAGAVYGQNGCPGSCVDFVNNNPSAFRDAFFDFAAMRVYQ